ncbi:unnamed protein product [Calypogeia fissa]
MLLAMVDCTRLWLPAEVCNSSVDEVSLALVGWVNVGPKSVDLVVAAACPVSQLSNPVIPQLQEVLDAAETKLPSKLRNERKLRVIGQYFVCTDDHSNSPNDNPEGHLDDLAESEETGGLMKPAEKCWHRSSGQVGEDYQKFASTTTVWAVVSARKSRAKRNGLEWTPYLRSLSFGACRSFVKYHIVIYQQPVFGSHHFSCSPWTPCHELSSQKSLGEKQDRAIKRPEWLTNAEQQEAADMDLTMMELNCATYVDGSLKDIWAPAGFSKDHPTMSSICCDYLWSPIAAMMAGWAAILYALAQGLALMLAVWLPSVPYLGSLLQRSITWQATHIRCQQLRAWPFIVLWGGLGPEQPNVAIANQMATVRYSTFSVLLIDEMIGAITGGFLAHKSTASPSLSLAAFQRLEAKPTEAKT